MLYAKIRRGSESAGGSAREARRAPAGLVYTDVIVDVSPVSMCRVAPCRSKNCDGVGFRLRDHIKGCVQTDV